MKRKAFTLVELLVVIAIIGVLVSLLMPAVQAAREAARRMSCSNNLHQLGIALHNYHDIHREFPAAGFFTPGVTGSNWSAQARLLPFLEQANLEDLIDWRLDYRSQPLVSETRIGPLLCPSEIRDQIRPSSPLNYYPLNYGINLGPWLVFDPATQRGGSGIAHPNSHINFAAILDGTTNTIAFSEVKAYNPYFRDGGSPNGLGVPIPTAPAQVLAWGGTKTENFISQLQVSD